MKKTLSNYIKALLLCLPLSLYAQTNQVLFCEALKSIRLPKIEMINANAIDVADFLIELTNPDTSSGIPLSIKRGPLGPDTQIGQTIDPRRTAYQKLPNVNVSLTNASMFEVLLRLTTAAGLCYEITNATVIIKGPDGKDLNRMKWGEPPDAVDASHGQ